MKTRLASYQPQFFPRLHYFARMLNADVFAVADYVQFVRKHVYPRQDKGKIRGPSFQAHCPIKTKGGMLLLDFPTKHGGLQPINETEIAFEKPHDRLKNFRLLREHYHLAPQYDKLAEPLEKFFQREFTTVADLNIASIFWSIAFLFELPCRTHDTITLEDIQSSFPYSPFRLKQIVVLSESGIEPPDKAKNRDANDWLIETCHVFDAAEYYFGGTSADAYMDFSKFNKAEISLIQQEWLCTPYQELWKEYLPNLSILDLLMNVSPAEARRELHTPHQ